MHTLITTTDALARACDAAASTRLVAMDTEFIREKTYYPNLCLVQMAWEGGDALIDPLAPGIDLSPLAALLADPLVLKLFHAPRQDIEIFYQLFGTLPQNVYDTQVAAQFQGFGEAISYGDFIRRMLGLSLDKSSQFTDWAARPLTEEQLSYALSDVVHLHAAYLKQRAELYEAGRLLWAEEEMRALNDVSLYRVLPQEAWMRLKAGSLKPRQLAILREIAAWREEEAMRRNLPRPRIVRDEVLVDIAQMEPKNREKLAMLRSIRSVPPHIQEKLFVCIERALASDPESWPASTRRRREEEIPADTMSMLQLLLARQARAHEMLPRLIATKDELEALARGARNIRPLQEWRYDMFGAFALKLLAGELTFAYDPTEKEVVVK